MTLKVRFRHFFDDPCEHLWKSNKKSIFLLLIFFAKMKPLLTHVCKTPPLRSYYWRGQKWRKHHLFNQPFNISWKVDNINLWKSAEAALEKSLCFRIWRIFRYNSFFQREIRSAFLRNKQKKQQPQWVGGFKYMAWRFSKKTCSVGFFS